MPPHHETSNLKQPHRRDDVARNALVEQWIPLCHFLVRKVFNAPGTGDRRRSPSMYDDAVQEAVLVAIHAAELWDETRGVTFGTYVWRAILRTVRQSPVLGGVVVTPRGSKGDNIPKWHMAQRTQALPAKWAMAVGEDEPERQTWLDHDLLVKARKRLCRKDRRALRLRFDLGMTLGEVGRQIGGVSKQMAAIYVRDALEHLRAALGVTP